MEVGLSLGDFRKELGETALSLAPAFAVIVLFQVLFLRMPLSDFLPIVLGFMFTVIGFVLFIQGAKIGLLPLGQNIGSAFIERRAVRMVLLFGFLLGIVLTVAEPDVRLLAFQIGEALEPRVSLALLIGVAAFGLGVMAVAALLRIVFDTPIHYVLIPGYALGMLLVLFSTESSVVQAFDMSAVTTGPMTVPFLLALGVGMSAVLGGRDRLKTGFGFMAIGSLGPIVVLLVLGLLLGGL